MTNEKKVDKWIDNETFSLIELWEENDNKLKSCNRREAIEEIRQKLAERSIDKTSHQITKKLDNLRQMYKKHRPSSTGGEPPKWRFFEAVHKILKSSHFYNPEAAYTSESTAKIDPHKFVKRGKKTKRNIDCVLEEIQSIVKDLKKEDEEDENSTKRMRIEIYENVKEINENIKSIMENIKQNSAIPQMFYPFSFPLSQNFNQSTSDPN